jgi:membrane protein implicated in regulation of membrane protease activity
MSAASQEICELGNCVLTQFSSLGAWNWFIAGGLLLVLEALAPGAFMAPLGLAALAVGGISLYVDWPWQVQFMAFAVLSVAGAPLSRRLVTRIDAETDQPFLNRRAEALVGRTFTLKRPIINGFGTIDIDDTVWRIAGVDMPARSRVKVTGVDGTTLHVELVDTSSGRTHTAGTKPER